MKVMSFDLSSVCIGVTTARIDNKNVERIMSCPIIPRKFSPISLGYKPSKKKMPTPRTGESVNTYWKDGEKTISKSEKERRDREIRKAANLFVLDYIGREMGNLINHIKPDLILVERNAAFNGILTTVLLAKIFGNLTGIAGFLQIPLKEYTVAEVRSIHNIPQLIKNFVSIRTTDELKLIPDITKAALREEMYKIYRDKGIVFQTDDESDSCVVLHYWRVKEGN